MIMTSNDPGHKETQAQVCSPDDLCHLWVLRLLIVAVALDLLLTIANAQISVVEARVAGVHGRAVISGHAHSQYSLVPGVVVNPGDEIDTSGGGRVTLELSDGSMLIVQPGSHVVLQDYRDASSLRELLHI